MNENQNPTGDEQFLAEDQNEEPARAAAESVSEVDGHSVDDTIGDDETEDDLEADDEEAELEASLAQDDAGVPYWERKPTQEEPSENIERVSKLMARGGIASRRACEEIITQGRVSINGHFVTEPGAKADPTRDRIVIDNKPLILSEKATTVLLLHKPKYVMTTKDDQGKRTTVIDLLPHKYQKLHPVGRLDYETTGVLLLSDDGELTNLLTHPSHGVEKVYEARVRGEVTREEVERLQTGIYLDDIKTAPCRVRVVAQREKNALIELTLREGRNRQVRRMLEAIGHPVSSLRRIKFGSVELEGLESGAFRVLLPGEVKMLRKHAEGGLKDSKKRAKTPHKAKSGGQPVAKPNSRPKPADARGAGAGSTESRSSGPKKPVKRGTGIRKLDSRGAAPRKNDRWDDNLKGAESKGPRGGTGKPSASSGPRPPRPSNKPRSEGTTPTPPPQRDRAPKEEQSPLAKRIEKKWR